MSSGHYGYWCATCNTPIKDGEQVIDLPRGVAHAACHCAVCRAPINECPYGGDCGEINRICRETQRKKLRDIDLCYPESWHE